MEAGLQSYAEALFLQGKFEKFQIFPTCGVGQAAGTGQTLNR